MMMQLLLLNTCCLLVHNPQTQKQKGGNLSVWFDNWPNTRIKIMIFGNFRFCIFSIVFSKHETKIIACVFLEFWFFSVILFLVYTHLIFLVHIIFFIFFLNAKNTIIFFYIFTYGL